MRVKRAAALLGATVLVASSGAAKAQDTPPPTPKPAPTQEDYDRLKKQIDELNAKVDAAKKKDEEQRTADAEKLGEIDKKASSAFDLADALRWGTTHLFFAGTAHVDYTYTLPARNTTQRSSSVFSAGLELDAIWKVNDWIYFEGGADFELNSQNSTDTSLALCDVSFVLNDYMVLRGGLMPTAFSRFKETLDPAWINKMVDAPLLEAIVPDTTVGIEARGAVPLGPMKMLYALYMFNDPILNTDDPVLNGTVSFDNYQGFDDIPGFGAKVGFLLLPELEVGGAFMWSKVGNRGTDFRQTDLFALDLYARFQKKTEIGSFDAQAEWAMQHVRRATYIGIQNGVDAAGNPIQTILFGPLRYTNEKQSGYFQVSYRPTQAENEIVKNFEFVVRTDWLGLPKRAAQGNNTDTNRVAAGIDYWFTPSIVLKAEYEYASIYGHTNLQSGTKTKDTESHTLTFQVGMGF